MLFFRAMMIISKYDALFGQWNTTGEHLLISASLIQASNSQYLRYQVQCMSYVVYRLLQDVLVVTVWQSNVKLHMLCICLGGW